MTPGAGASPTSSGRSFWTSPTSRCCWSSRRRRSPAAAFTAQSAPGAVGACATVRPSSAIRPRSCRPAPTARHWTRCDEPSQRMPAHVVGRRPVRRAMPIVPKIEVLPARGFCTAPEKLRRLGAGASARCCWRTSTATRGRRTACSWTATEPAGGAVELRRRQPRAAPEGRPTLGVEPPWARRGRHRRQVRADLDRWERDGDVSFVGRDGPRRFAATRSRGAGAPSTTSSSTGSPHFGPHEDAMLSRRPVDGAQPAVGADEPRPARPARGASTPPKRRTAPGEAPLASVEGFVRQVIGWRDYVWHLYWHFGRGYRRRNALDAHARAPALVRRPRRRRRRRALPVRRPWPRCATTAGCTTSRG